MDIKSQIDALKDSALGELGAVDQARDLESWRVRYLGKKSRLTELLRGLSALPIEERREAGALSNALKLELESAFAAKDTALKQHGSSGASTGLDISLPGRPYPQGHLHLMSQTIAEICDIFTRMGFQVAEGPEVEWD